ncbi:MAG: tyrosine-type recombinase/integrase [Candidatus Diapherotrites archaeon]|nr:tyrosine-type recombinase/integrase [Candidatus Diapherotrites archaeon]
MEDHLYKRPHSFELLRSRIWPDEFPYNGASYRERRVYTLTPANRLLLRRYLVNLENQNYGLNRKYRLIEIMAVLGEMFCRDFESATKDDIQGQEGLVSKIMHKWTNDTTKEMYIQGLKQFYKWFGQTTEYPEVVKGIKFQKKKGKKLLDIPTEEKIAELIQAAGNPMHKAMISTIYSSAGRIGEIARLQVKDVIFQDDEAVIHILHSKTEERQVLLVDSTVQLLREALLYHPHRDKEDFQDRLLFVSVAPSSYGKPFGYAAIVKILKQCAEKVRIKGLHPHLLRHARATHLIQRGLNEMQLKVVLGHSYSSRATAVYLHLSGKDTYDAIRTVNGKKRITEEKQNPLLGKKCDICATNNTFEDKVCRKCQRPLGVLERMEYKDQMKTLQEHILQMEQLNNERMSKMEKAYDMLLQAILKQREATIHQV